MINKDKRNKIFLEMNKKLGNKIALDVEQSIYIFSQKYADDNGTPFLLEDIYDSKVAEISNILNSKNLMFIIINRKWKVLFIHNLFFTIYRKGSS